MDWASVCAAAVMVCVAACGCELGEAGERLPRLGEPAVGQMYHGVFPGGYSGAEDDITAEQVGTYEEAVGKRVAWVYFSHNWYQGTEFPRETAEWIRGLGAVPFIRLMLREEGNRVGTRFSVRQVLDGELDADLRRWGEAAREFGTPLVAEFGTEVNGQWFPWNGVHHGGGQTDGFGDATKPDGPERFVAAYRRIADIIGEAGASNVTWVFHVDATDDPEEWWNRFENYYPGDEYVDWVGVTAYGPQQPREDEAESFREQMDGCYARLEEMAPGKPVIVAEFGCTAGSRAADPAVWAGGALADILGGRWPRVIGFSWWNESWENDDNPAHNTTMRVEEIPALAEVFRRKLEGGKEKLVERPVVRG